MPADKELTEQQAFDLADEMMESATLVFRRRRDTPDMSDSQYDELMRQEMALRSDSDRYRAVGIRLLASDGSVTASSLMSSIKDANDCLGNIQKVRNYLSVLSALVEFGAAVASGNLDTIAGAGSKLGKAITAAKKDEDIA